MDEAKLVNSLNSQGELCHVEAGNVFGEDLIFDEHRHQVSAWQKLHEHVQERGILKRGMELDNPGAI